MGKEEEAVEAGWGGANTWSQEDAGVVRGQAQTQLRWGAQIAWEDGARGTAEAKIMGQQP